MPYYGSAASSCHFNPRSREGSDSDLKQSTDDSGISIHAPVKGATNQSLTLAQTQLISIHAPVKGATGNDTGRRKRDIISIHAPVKGATYIAVIISAIFYFNPRSREGSDQLIAAFSSITANFNPRSREGSDAYHARSVYDPRYFNPRSREGSD